MKKKDKLSVKYDKLEILKRKCEHCGHNQYVLNSDKTICSWCKHYIYASPMAKFRNKLKETIVKNKMKEVK